MRKNRPILSRMVDPLGTKGGPRAWNFPGPPKNTFCPGSWLHSGQKAPTPTSPFFLPSSPTLCGFLDLRRTAAVPCSYRASCSPPPPSPSAANLRRPSSTAPSHHRCRAPPSPSAVVDVPHPVPERRAPELHRLSAVGPPPHHRSAPLESPARFTAVSSTLCAPPLARPGPASVAPATLCLDTAAPTPARRRLRLDVAALPPRR
jgi:hypothetical protein